MNKSPAHVTFRLLQRRTRALERHLPAAIAGNDHGLHQARVATRRLREAVPVLSPEAASSSSVKAGRKIRRLTRAFGTVRELDVTIHLLDELARTQRVPRVAVEEVRAHVLAERDARRARMLKRLDRVDPAKLSRRLATIADALDDSTDQGWRTVLATRLVKRARRLTRVVEAAGQLYEPERLHAVRIAAKKLRYGLELAAESGVPAATPHVRTIKRVQDVLGRLNDLHVLERYVATIQADGPTRPGLEDGLKSLARYLEQDARHVHGRFLALAPSLAEAGRSVIADVVPHVDRRAGRSLKMPLRASSRPRSGARAQRER